jgi:hypothetical protein
VLRVIQKVGGIDLGFVGNVHEDVGEPEVNPETRG